MEKLINIQKNLKAPKGQQNTFGNYKYRSCEDILQAVTPLLNWAILILTDDVVLIWDRYYVKATARFIEWDKEVSNTAYARESELKRGMDSAQITWAASSYARKYALNWLFLIDDTKDADTDEFTKKTGQNAVVKKVVKQKAAPGTWYEWQIEAASTTVELIEVAKKMSEDVWLSTEDKDKLRVIYVAKSKTLWDQ